MGIGIALKVQKKFDSSREERKVPAKADITEESERVRGRGRETERGGERKGAGGSESFLSQKQDGQGRGANTTEPIYYCIKCFKLFTFHLKNIR